MIRLYRLSSTKLSLVTRRLLILSAALLTVSCSSKSDTDVPEDFVIDGIYSLSRITRTSDGVSFAELQPPDASGVLKINGTSYYRDRSIQGSQDVDEGTFDYYNGVFVFYSNTADDNKHGTYNVKQETITINYTLGDYLYTETWTRVEPVGGS